MKLTRMKNRHTYIKAKNKYNNTRKRAKRKFMRNEAIKLENIANSEPRNFWKSIKKSYNQEKNNQESPIKIEDFYEHFEIYMKMLI